MVDIWKSEFEWREINLSNGNEAWNQYIPQSESVDDIIDTHDIMFRWNKCFSGVTFRYIYSLDDINNRNIITSDDALCLYHRYNEYDLIDDFLTNYIQVDIIYDNSLDLSSAYYEIDGVIVRPGQKILLVNQANYIENGIYSVNNNYKLIRSDELNDPDTSERFHVYCKMGKYFDKEMYLSPILSGSSWYFPLTGDTLNFFTGGTYILKHVIDYQLNSSVPKVVFSDIDIARKQISDNYLEYNYINLSSQTVTDLTPFIINYHDYSYTIRINTANTFTDYVNVSGITGLTNIYNDNSGITHITLGNTMTMTINDYINLNIYYPNSGGTYLNYSCFIDSTGSTITINPSLPNHVIYQMNILTGASSLIYKARNYQYCTNNITNFNECINNMYFGKYLTTYTDPITADYYLITKENIQDEYFDYDAFSFDVNGFNTSFYTDNQYIKYQLQPFLHNIWTGFTSGYTLYNNYILTGTSYQIDYSGGTIHITGTTSEISYFEPYTYVNFNTELSLVLEVLDSYMTISIPDNSGYTIYSGLTIQNIYQLGDISDILYNIYSGEISINDNYKKKIYNEYGKILQNNSGITSYVTGIIYGDDNGRYLFKLYNEDDPLLTYMLTELLVIMANKKSKFPVRLKNDNIVNE